MMLIGDAGATKTDWRLVDSGNIRQFSQKGFNATTSDWADFLSECRTIFNDISPHLTRIYFYGAGILPVNQKKFTETLESIFSFAEVSVASDLLGAARSLLGKDPGRVGILGTGSGGCIYDGKAVGKKISSLGYILGDEGSGSYLGKKLISRYLRGQLSKEMKEHFHQAYGHLKEHEILEKIYSEHAASYLASYASFLVTHQSHSEIYRLVYDGFRDYYDVFWKSVEPDHLPFAFTGSVAHFLSNILRKVITDKGHQVALITQSPIAGLTLYHQQHEL